MRFGAGTAKPREWARDPEQSGRSIAKFDKKLTCGQLGSEVGNPRG